MYAVIEDHDRHVARHATQKGFHNEQRRSSGEAIKEGTDANDE